jgi:hypothetical protein
MAAAGRNGPLVPHIRPCALIQCNKWMVNNPPSKWIYFGGLLRVCMALKTLQCCGDASSPEQRSALRAIHTLNPQKKYIRKLGRLLPIHLMHLQGAQGLMWGARGPFLLAEAMVVVVVTPVVVCAKATEILKNAKNSKISCFYRIILSILYIVKHIIIHILLIVAWPEPKLLGSRSPNHFGPMDPGILGIPRTLLSL